MDGYTVPNLHRLDWFLVSQVEVWIGYLHKNRLIAVCKVQLKLFIILFFFADYCFPYMVLVVSVITSAAHFAYFIEQVRHFYYLFPKEVNFAIYSLFLYEGYKIENGIYSNQSPNEPYQML